MSKAIEKGFVPLSSVDGRPVSSRILINLNLPEVVDADRIGINIPRLETICNLAGIEGLLVRGLTEVGTSREVPVIAGINKDGSAMAGKKVEKTTVPASAAFQTPLPFHEDMGRRTSIITLGLNIDELSQKASQSNEGVRSTEVWSKNLDRAIKIPLRKAGTDNLINHWDFKTKMNYLFAPAMVGLIDAIRSLNPSIVQYGEQLAWLALFLRGAEFVQTHKDPHFRQSLFIGPQLDRAAVLQAKARTQKLVVDLHPDKK